MIPKEDLAKNLLTELLGCGYADTESLIDLISLVENTKFTINGQEEFLMDDEGSLIGNIIEDVKDMGVESPDVNWYIDAIFRRVIGAVGDRYGIEWEEEDYSTYTNFLDSHLFITEEGSERLRKLLTEEQAKEIESIIENFN
jgi:hypothetical protein